MENKELNEQLGHVHSPRYVDPLFLERLHRLDPKLEPRWNPAKCRWEIFRAGQYILTVQSVSGDYTPLDNRVMHKLFMIDTHRYAKEVDFIRELHSEDEHILNMKRHEQDEFVRACYRDMAPFLRGRKSVVTSKVQEAK
jgi:hypothetical protein